MYWISPLHCLHQTRLANACCKATSYEVPFISHTALFLMKNLDLNWNTSVGMHMYWDINCYKKVYINVNSTVQSIILYFLLFILHTFIKTCRTEIYHWCQNGFRPVQGFEHIADKVLLPDEGQVVLVKPQVALDALRVMGWK